MTVALRIIIRMSKARMQTAAYWTLGLALAAWLAGDMLWILRPEARGPFPGLADWFWLAGYPAACAGLALLRGARLPARGRAAAVPRRGRDSAARAPGGAHVRARRRRPGAVRGRRRRAPA